MTKAEQLLSMEINEQKSAFDKLKNTVTAWAILKSGKEAGKMVSVRSSNNRVVASVNIWSGPLQTGTTLTGITNGWGYDVLSTALYMAFKNAEIPIDDEKYVRYTTFDRFLEGIGYEIIKVIG